MPERHTPTFVEAIKGETALSSTYARGSRLARAAFITGCQADESGGVARLTGSVRGSYGQSYQVSVSLDLKTHEIADHDCTCPAHANYAGMCKHTVALALNYLYVRGLSPLRNPDPAPVAPAGAQAPAQAPAPTPMRKAGHPPSSPRPQARTKARPTERPLPKTSRQIAELIGGYADQALVDNRRLAQGAPAREGERDEPPAELECQVLSADAAWRASWSRDTWALGLRIVRGKAAYVVRRIDELVDAWREGATVSYGKNLAFAHRPGAFSERANRLLKLLSQVVEAQRSLYAAQESRSYSYSSYSYQSRMSAKTLPLSTAQLLEVLRVMEGAKVTYVTERYVPREGSQRRRRSLAVVAGNPRPTVRVRRADRVWELTVEPAGLEAIGDERGLCLADASHLCLCDEGFSHDLGIFFSSVLPLDGPLSIRDADMPRLCAAALPALERHVDLRKDGGVDDFMPPAAELSFRIGAEGGRVVCIPTVSYGGERLSLFAEAYDEGPVRDVGREQTAQRLVRAYFPFGDQPTPSYGSPRPGRQRTVTPAPSAWDARWARPEELGDPWFDRDDDEAYYRLFSEGLAELAELGEVQLSEGLRHVAVRPAPALSVRAEVSGGLLDLGLSADGLDARELIAYLSSYRRRQRYVRLDDGDIMRLDGSLAAVAGLAEGLGLGVEELVEGGLRLPANRTLFVDAMLKRADGVSLSRNRAFRKIVRDFETVADADFAVPATVTATLRPYQQDGFRWLCTLGAVGFGGILADDMGLGKTLQAIAYLAHAREAGSGRPALVVCPASLVYNWEAELRRFAPSLELGVVAGQRRQRASLISAAPDYDVLVTSYDLMKRDIDAYEQVRFGCVVLDEAHYVKNPGTQVARAAKRLVADVRLALTGTPIENRLTELWSIFDFLMPGVLGSAESFSRRFAAPIASGDEGAAERLRRLVSPFVLRRLKRDVLAELPEKSESLVTTPLAGEQAKLYRASAQRLRMQVERQLPEEFAGMRLQILAELTKLRQICCDPHLAFENYRGGSAKLDACMELVASAIEGGHQLLVFSQFTTMLERIAARLDKERVGHLTLTGSTPKRERQRLVERFQAGAAPVFLISLKAGGVGLNLTAADIVIHFDPWWNVAVEDQATDRAHRIGQTREVSVFKLIAKDTIEERIVAMQQSKRTLADAVIGGEGMGAATITRDDLLTLLDG